jgi:hypothetical protein
VSEERARASELIERVLRKDPAFQNHVSLECVA